MGGFSCWPCVFPSGTSVVLVAVESKLLEVRANSIAHIINAKTSYFSVLYPYGGAVEIVVEPEIRGYCAYDGDL
jgi:hypothetical protein